jgi:hypothetical protein
MFFWLTKVHHNRLESKVEYTPMWWIGRGRKWSFSELFIRLLFYYTVIQVRRFTDNMSSTWVNCFWKGERTLLQEQLTFAHGVYVLILAVWNHEIYPPSSAVITFRPILMLRKCMNVLFIGLGPQSLRSLASQEIPHLLWNAEKNRAHTHAFSNQV